MAVEQVVRAAGQQSVGTRVVGPVVRPVGKALMVENWVEVAISMVEKSLAEKSLAEKRKAVDY